MGRIFDLRKVDHALKSVLVEGNLTERQLGIDSFGQYRAVFLTGTTESEVTVPPFIHPYLIENFKNKGYLVTDARLFKNVSANWVSDRDFEVNVKNKAEYALLKSRAALNLLWISDDITRIRTRFNFAAHVFASWLAQAITRAYALNFQEQAWVRAVSLYYYYALFTDAPRLEGDQLETAVVHTIKATKMPATEVYSLFEKLPVVQGVDDYIHLVQQAVDNVRLRDFNLAILLTLVRNTWYGANAKEMISVALEHPPTWIAIVYATLTERTYKSSALYKVVDEQGKRGNADEFRMNYNDLVSVSIMTQESIEEEIVFKDFVE